MGTAELDYSVRVYCAILNVYCINVVALANPGLFANLGRNELTNGIPEESNR